MTCLFCGGGVVDDDEDGRGLVERGISSMGSVSVGVGFAARGRRVSYEDRSRRAPSSSVSSLWSSSSAWSSSAETEPEPSFTSLASLLVLLSVGSVVIVVDDDDDVLRPLPLRLGDRDAPVPNRHSSSTLASRPRTRAFRASKSSAMAGVTTVNVEGVDTGGASLVSFLGLRRGVSVVAGVVDVDVDVEEGVGGVVFAGCSFSMLAFFCPGEVSFGAEAFFALGILAGEFWVEFKLADWGFDAIVSLVVSNKAVIDK